MLSSVSSAGGKLEIWGNAALTSVSGFASLRSIGSGRLSYQTPIYITNNRRLSVCCWVFPFVQASLPSGYTLGGTGTPDISGNKAGCNTVQQIRNGGMCPHTVAVSTMTEGVTVGTLSGTSIAIRLPVASTSAALTIDIGNDATSWTATEASDPANFVSAAPASGTGDGTLTISYSANTGTTPRSATITVTTMPAGPRSTSRTLLLTQAAGKHIGNIVLNSAEAITDAIKALTRIEGNLTIGDAATGTDIDNDDLAGFQLRTITGDLTIDGTTLTELNAFTSLTKVGGTLRIGDSNGSGNNALTSVSGFTMLDSIGGYLDIWDNDLLTSLPSFTALRHIGAGVSDDNALYIVDNPQLSTCCGVWPFVQASLPASYTLGGNGALIQSQCDRLRLRPRDQKCMSSRGLCKHNDDWRDCRHPEAARA